MLNQNIKKYAHWIFQQFIHLNIFYGAEILLNQLYRRPNSTFILIFAIILNLSIFYMAYCKSHDEFNASSNSCYRFSEKTIVKDTPRKLSSFNTSLEITAVGDCTFGNDYREDDNKGTFSYYTNNLKKPYNYFFDKVEKYFVHSDLNIANCESVLTNSNKPINKRNQEGGEWWMRGQPDYANIFKRDTLMLLI